jgi:hypothetical protein
MDTYTKVVTAIVPKETKTYKPLPHRTVIDLIEEEIFNSDLVIKTRSFITNRSCTQVVGKYTFEGADSNIDIQLFFKNSYDKTMAFGIALGGQVIVCTNGMISAEYVLRKKHTGNIVDTVKYYIRSKLRSISRVYNDMLDKVERMKKAYLTKGEVYALIGLYLLKVDVSNTFKTELKEQLEKLNDKYTITYWEVYNIVTALLKENKPSTYIQNHIALHETFISNNNYTLVKHKEDK